MAQTKVDPTKQFQAGEIGRNLLNQTTPGDAVVLRIIAGTNVSISSTGADAGTGDVTINATGGGGGGTIYQALVDFGTEPLDGTKFTITTISCTVGQKVIVSAAADMPAGVDMDELEMDGLICAARVSATNTIEVQVMASPGPVTGQRNFNLMVI